MPSKSFKLTVKNGDSKFTYNETTGKYDSKTIDYVVEPADLGDALLQFLEWANDEVIENKVTLTILPTKKGKKGN